MAKNIDIQQQRRVPTSTVGRGKSVDIDGIKTTETEWVDEYVNLRLGDSLEYYSIWENPTVIVSDGGYGILGFEGDTSNHLGLPEWYEPHIKSWS